MSTLQTPDRRDSGAGLQSTLPLVDSSESLGGGSMSIQVEWILVRDRLALQAAVAVASKVSTQH